MKERVDCTWLFDYPLHGRMPQALRVANVEGTATAITVLTPLKRDGPLLLWFVFWAGRNIKETLKKLEMLFFSH